MKARGRLLLFACVVASLALPAGASAKPGYVVKPKSLELHAEVPARNGWAMSLDTWGHRQVVLTATKGDFVVLYKTLGRVTRKGIEADFGRFGRVSLRFHAKPEPRRVAAPSPPDVRPRPQRRQCSGRRPVIERGIFRGNLRFEGERGYTGTVSHRLKGNVKRSYRQVCKRGSFLVFAAREKEREEFVTLAAFAQIHGEKRFFQAFKTSGVDEGPDGVGLSIEVGAHIEKVGRVLVSKAVLTGLDQPSSYVLSPRGTRPVTAEITPPSPFSGTGLYRAEGNLPPTWTGSLGVQMPGLGLVSMVGPEFEPFFCRAAGEGESERCLNRLEAAVEAAGYYGSGSHSQPLALARLSSLR